MIPRLWIHSDISYMDESRTKKVRTVPYGMLPFSPAIVTFCKSNKLFTYFRYRKVTDKTGQYSRQSSLVLFVYNKQQTYELQRKHNYYVHVSCFISSKDCLLYIIHPIELGSSHSQTMTVSITMDTKGTLCTIINTVVLS